MFVLEVGQEWIDETVVFGTSVSWRWIAFDCDDEKERPLAGLALATAAAKPAAEWRRVEAD